MSFAPSLSFFKLQRFEPTGKSYPDFAKPRLWTTAFFIIRGQFLAVLMADPLTYTLTILWCLHFPWSLIQRFAK